MIERLAFTPNADKRIAMRGIIFVAAMLLVACTKPIPTDKLRYVGEWRSSAMFLLITPDGSLKYVREKQGSTTKINVPIKDFDGNNIVAGVGPATTTFFVSKPPYQDGDQWKMVVDDELLTKIHD